MVTQRRDSGIGWSDGFAAALIVAGGAIAATAIFVLFVEAFEWLSSREWPGLTLADGLSLFGLQHEVAESETQRLIDLLVAAPLSAALFGTGVMTILGGTKLGDRAEKERPSPARDTVMTLLSNDVSTVRFFRIVLLDRLLGLCAWVGAAVFALGVLLYTIGGEPSVAITGLIILASALLVRLLTRRDEWDDE